MSLRAHSPIRSRPRRTRPAVAAAAVIALSATLAPVGTAVAGPQPGSSTLATAAKAETVDVMTRNLYLGSGLDRVITAIATPGANVPAAATATWATVTGSNPPKRMEEIAEEIREQMPAVVGLQEVTTWTTYPEFNPSTGQPVGSPTDVYDFLELLLTALDDEYVAVGDATAHNFASPAIPYFDGEGSGLGAIKLADRDVILVRDDDSVTASNGHAGTFETLLSLPLATPPGAPPQVLPVLRGWGSADVATEGGAFRFVNAHTEAWGAESIRIAQVQELFAAQDDLAGALPMVYVGDYNSPAPEGGGYEELRTRLRDAWLSGNGNASGTGAGNTCCQDGDLSNETSDLTSRIDLVLMGERVRALSSSLTGTIPVEIDSDTHWASDHAGVVARLVIPAPAS